MERYRHLWLWMFVPMAIMQIGIFHDYWGDFSQNAWAVHVHYWTASLWYLFLVLQPYFATHGQLARHRTNGIVGMFLAGGVAATALSMTHRDMASAEKAAEFPERFGPFEPWFFHGVIVVEFMMMSAFTLAVVQAIRHRRSLHDHAWWLVSTVFIIMFPALGRGLQTLLTQWYGFNHAAMMNASYLSIAIIVAMALLAAWKFGRLGHPATALAVGVNLSCLLIEPIGKSPWVQEALKALIRD